MFGSHTDTSTGFTTIADVQSGGHILYGIGVIAQVSHLEELHRVVRVVVTPCQSILYINGHGLFHSLIGFILRVGIDDVVVTVGDSISASMEFIQ